MKKLLIIIIIVLLVFTGIGVAVWHYAPYFAFRLIGKAIGGSVVAKESSVAYRNGALFLNLNGVTTKGMVEGKIDRCEVEFLLAKGIYIRRLVVSDFDILVKNRQGGLKFFPLPVERAEITNGSLNYGGRKYVIREIRVSNFNTGKTLKFSIDGGAEGLGNIKTHGEGFFGGEKRSDIKGEYSLSQVDIGKILTHYEGLTDSQGTFTYRYGTLTVDGRGQAPYFSVWERFFLNRISQKDNEADIHLTWTGETIDMTLTGLHFRDTPFSLRFRSRQKELLYLELTTEFMPIPEVLKYVDVARLSEKDWGPFSYVTDGEVKIGRLVFRKEKPLVAQIDLRGAVAGDGKIFLTDVEGSLRVDDKLVILSNFGGRYGESGVSRIFGVIPLGVGQNVDLRGGYDVDLRDVERFYKADGISAEAGLAEGQFELTGRKHDGFRVTGTGVLRNGRLVARGVPLQAAGEYLFDTDCLEFTRLHVAGSGTDIELAGEIREESMDVSGRGTVNVRHLVLASMVPSQYSLSGMIGVEGSVKTGRDKFSAKGKLSMTDLSLEIPGFFKKSSGVSSAATVSISAGQGKDELSIDELDLTLDTLRAQATGRMNRTRVTDAHLLLDVPGIERAFGLFFFDPSGARGDLKADITFADLRFPVELLPAIHGSLALRNGAVRLPFLVEPVSSINLDCGFSGDSFTFDAHGVTVGSSIVEKARLTLDGLRKPSFDMRIEMSHFDSRDFRSPVTKPFRLPVIEKDSLVERTSGAFLLTAKTMKIGELTGEDAVVEGHYGQSRVSLKVGRMKTETGSVSLVGSTLLSPLPEVQVTAELKDVSAAKVLELTGGRAGIIEGKGSVSADLRFTGTDLKDLLRGATGRVDITSENGVIKKWNLISKLLALTNVYDLFLGRVDLTQRGLSYSHLNVTLEGQNGVFGASNFLIDSPSMVITGRGTVDLSQNSIDGRMLVSPLVMLDRIIDWIPLVRNIFRERKTGILFFIYDVKGPMSDPEIRSSYVESMGKRIINIFMNTIRLPKDVLDLLPKEPAK